jgi:Tol biopolymer transport system component
LRRARLYSWLLLGATARCGDAQPAAVPLGTFQDHGDVGTVLHAGSAEYDASNRSYTIVGSGENMWATADAFQFVWTKVSGDVALAADIVFAGSGGDAHKKAVLMVRQSLDADSAYADVALHGNGLTSLQARDEKGAATHEIQSNMPAPKRLRIEKRGAYFYISLGGEDRVLHMAGGSMRVPLEGTFYVGLGVCAHNKDVVEKAVFSNVDLTALSSTTAGKTTLFSTLETITVTSTDRRVTYVTPGRIEAPNWTRDGAALLFNSGGRIQRVPVAGGKPTTIDTGFAVHANGSHGISPDGTLLAISDESREHRRSVVYVIPVAGGVPRRVTRQSPSYWQGWSPDGKTILIAGQRRGKFGIFTVPAAGGEETRLAAVDGGNAGAEYAPDGKSVYFSSGHAGGMQIWRMLSDGTGMEQVTSDGFDNVHPHLSPDGRRMVFLSSEKGTAGQSDMRDVMLRMMSLTDKRTVVLAKLIGGPGTIDAPSWSPDGRQLAFVSYQMMR